MLFNVFVAIHLLVCSLLVIVILMQSSKGGGLGAAFGVGGQTIFGGRETATFLSKATTYLAIIFMVTSLSLAFLSAGRGPKGRESALRKAAQRGELGTIAPEEQKNVDEIIGNVPEATQQGQEGQGKEAEQKAPEKK